MTNSHYICKSRDIGKNSRHILKKSRPPYIYGNNWDCMKLLTFDDLLKCDRIKLQILEHLHTRKDADTTNHIAKNIGEGKVRKADNNTVKKAVLFLAQINLVSIDERKQGDKNKLIRFISLTEDGIKLADSYKGALRFDFEEKRKKLGLTRTSSA